MVRRARFSAQAVTTKSHYHYVTKKTNDSQRGCLVYCSILQSILAMTFGCIVFFLLDMLYIYIYNTQYCSILSTECATVEGIN